MAAKVVIVCDGNEVHVESEHSLPTTAKMALTILREVASGNTSTLSGGFGLVTELDPQRGDSDALARK